MDIIEFLVSPEVYRKFVAVVGWKVSVAMASATFVVLMLSEDGDLVIFMELLVVPMEVLLVGRGTAAEVDKMCAVNLVVSAMGVFKNFGTVIVFRGGDVILEYAMVV